MDSDYYYYCFDECNLINYTNFQEEIKMEKKLFDILKERGYVKDLTHEKEIIDLINGDQ